MQKPTVTQAIFGVGPLPHFQGNGWILETTNANTLQLRNTSGGNFLDFAFIHPAACAANSGTMSTTFRFSTNAGETLQGPLCNEGSTTLVNIWVFGANNTLQFRCHRATGNHNVCQRLF